MNTKGSSVKEITYKCISFCLLFGFVYYWLFTFSLVFFNKSIRVAAPRQYLLYYSFFNQNWRLFAFTKTYSTEVELVVRKINNPSATDTVSLFSFSMTEKRKHAPFNNYEDALERLLDVTVSDIVRQAEKKKLLLKKQFPGKEEIFYVQETSMQIGNDKYQQRNIKNVENYGKYVLGQKQTDTTGKEFQLIIVHHYIDPAKAPVATAGNTNDEIIFISTFRSFK